MESDSTRPGHEHCGARTRSGQPCKRPAGWGTTHLGVGTCRLHLGSTRTNQAAAARVLAERGAQTILAGLGEPVPIVNPTRRLLEVLGEIDLLREAARRQVAELGDWVAKDNFGAEQTKADVRFYADVLVQLERGLVDAARLRLEERLVAIDEATADLVLAVADRALKTAVPAEFHGRFREAFVVEARSREVVAG